MKTILLAILVLLVARIHAETNEALSGVFSFDVRETTGTTEAISRVFSMDARDLGNSASVGSGSFLLNTLGTAPTELEIVGPASVVAGSKTDYRVIWHAGFSDLDVTSDARWRFLTVSPGNTGMVPPTFYAGETNTPATVQVVASYLAATGQSKESPAFAITITPHLKAAVETTQTGIGKFTLTAAPSNNRGATTVSWDLNGDGTYGDAYGETATVDYGSWTGTTKVKVLVTDGVGNTRIETRDVVVNKAPVINQPTGTKPTYDPTDFFLLLPDQTKTPFVFNPNGLDRRSTGLVVIAHGLYSSTQEDWMREMGAGIENRCIQNHLIPPNVALLDWSGLSMDPSPLPPLQEALLKALIVGGLQQGNWVSACGGATGEAINFGFDLWWVKKNGIVSGQNLANWIYLNSCLGSKPQIDKDKPIHLIGHSAGGFVVGEAARILKHPSSGLPPVFVDRVTMLDTPFVEKSYIAQGSQNYPNPGTAERYVSSIWGSLAFGWPVSTNAYYRYENIWTAATPGYNWISHGDAHNWYTRSTVWKENDPDATLDNDGFAFSPILSGIKVAASTQRRMLATSSNGVQVMPDYIPSGWQTFGSAVEDAGTWSLTEVADAGMWTDMTMPVAAQNLSFEFHFAQSGDGDFLAVHFGDMPVLYRGIDQALSRDGWVSAEIPLDLIGATNGKLVFTLVSRGNPNAHVQLRNIKITQTNDVDGDGLTNDEEAALATDPRNPDTDADGLNDGVEVNTYQTDPLRADTDGDGQNDASELAAGTDPRLNGSFFRVTDIHKTAAGGMTLNWPGVLGKTYRVRRSQELGTDNYEIIGQGIPAAQALTSFTDTAPPAGRGFYWVEVE